MKARHAAAWGVVVRLRPAASHLLHKLRPEEHQMCRGPPVLADLIVVIMNNEYKVSLVVGAIWAM